MSAEGSAVQAMAPPGIKDVAHRAGVSVGTVSNVLNRPDLVSDQTRQKVQDAIAALGFVRNESARHLRNGLSQTIAYLLLDTGNPFFTDVARGAEEAARAAGLALFLCNSEEDVSRELEYLEILLEQRVRGVLITPVDHHAERLRMMPQLGVPVVLLDRAADDPTDWCSVAVNDVEGGDLAVTHLLELGHTRIGFVGGPSSIVQVADRHRGALRAFDRAGVPTDQLVHLDTAALTIAEGRRAGQRVLGFPARRRPTAVFCANDLVAIGFLQQMIQQGVAVPEDMAIVGYDDIEFAAAAAVPLTSVSQPRYELGRRACELLLAEAEAMVGRSGDEGHHVHQQVEFTPELVVRASSGRRLASRPA
ncbi:MAG: LacI family DNA-binding transcriptional regulator [Kineosporiaceae bacterium]